MVCHTGLWTSFEQDQNGTPGSRSKAVYRIRIELCSSLILLERCLPTCMTYTIAVCTVKNSWCWTEELSETCRISFQNKFKKLVHLVCFIIRICLYTYFIFWLKCSAYGNIKIISNVCLSIWMERYTLIFIAAKFKKAVILHHNNVLFCTPEVNHGCNIHFVETVP
jgi:hypothetical protein